MPSFIFSITCFDLISLKLHKDIIVNIYYKSEAIIIKTVLGRIYKKSYNFRFKLSEAILIV
jgi:hypothetical protein